jgi:hypothetical protein
VGETAWDSAAVGIGSGGKRVQNTMRVVYAIFFVLFVLAMGVLEIESSRATARIANYPDPPVSASPAGLGR